MSEQKKAKCAECGKEKPCDNHKLCDECHWWFIVGLFN